MSVSSASNPVLGTATVDTLVASNSSGLVITSANGSTVTFDVGSGVPTGKVRNQGSIWVRTNGTTSSTVLYVNVDGDSTWLGVQ
jgi:hypothetical protein